MTNFKINDRIVGENATTFIVAELSANHNQSYELAEKTIIAAKEAGADAVKLQTYTADTITLDSDKDYFKIQHGTVWDGTTLHKLYQKAFTPWEWHAPLKKLTEKLGMIFFSTPFDFTAVDFLEDLGVGVYKVASFEVHDIPLIEKIASKKKPIIISTGIASLGDMDEAVSAIIKNGNGEFCLLKCTSSYPAPIEEINLKTMPKLGEIFNCVYGVSDHTLGGTVSSAAVALGASIVEKHFILDRSLGGEDSSFSMEPKEFKKMVSEIRIVEKALGRVEFGLTKSTQVAKSFGRSLFISEDIKAGEKLTEKNIRSVRPAGGLHPRYYYEILGREARIDLTLGEPLKWEFLR